MGMGLTEERRKKKEERRKKKEEKRKKKEERRKKKERKKEVRSDYWALISSSKTQIQIVGKGKYVTNRIF